ncbi:MAG TPA: formate dehydrogenase accessory sulfurtransferase FdhD [Rhodothermales bacterium]|nr:formate dehydrogenase accessory sulfurtransferase FdhD [Rhodothermales bacterium]
MKPFSTVEVPVMSVNGDGSATRLDVLAVEEPLEIRIIHPSTGETTISVTMRTPGSDAELAIGFLYGEGIIRSLEDVLRAGKRVRAACGKENIVVIELAESCSPDLGKLTRHFYTTSSCGVCGKASIEAIEVLPVEELPVGDLRLKAETIHEFPARIEASQALFERTGGLHAAALFTFDGDLIELREDVGRHNAMDKLIGSLVRKGELPASERIIMVSGRASFELVQKVVMAGVPVLAAVGAPSSLAVELASRFGITLIGFVRDRRFNVYTKPIRISELAKQFGPPTKGTC